MLKTFHLEIKSISNLNKQLKKQKVAKVMKEDTKLKGLCKECTHRNSCKDAKRYLEMTACSNYRKWKKKHSNEGDLTWK